MTAPDPIDFPCPVCGRAPVYTETAHHNHTFRCDGDLRDLALSPRHTIYVFSAHREEAASLWRKATSREALAAEPPSAPDQSEIAGSLREVLQMLAMVPEHLLTGLRVDPYGTIGDALEALGESRAPDSWRALARFAGLPDPGEEKPSAPAQGSPGIDEAEAQEVQK